MARLREANAGREEEKVLAWVEELESELAKAKETGAAAIAGLETDVAAHVATIKASATRPSDLKDAEEKMRGMQSPRSRDAAEQGFGKEIGDLEGRLSNAK